MTRPDAQHTLPDVQLLPADVSAFSFESELDVVTTLDVIEDIDDGCAGHRNGDEGDEARRRVDPDRRPTLLLVARRSMTQ